MAAHSSIPAWRIPWTEEPGGLQSITSQSQTRLKPLSTESTTFPASVTTSMCNAAKIHFSLLLLFLTIISPAFFSKLVSSSQN